LVFCSKQHFNGARADALAEQGAKVIQVDEVGDSGALDLVQVLEALGDAGVQSVMVEGGSGVIKSFLRQRLANRVVITIAPSFAGGLRAVEEGSLLTIQSLSGVTYQQFGSDIVVTGWLNEEGK